jgi:hypothetical protein
MRHRLGHGHQYNILLIPNVMKYTIVQDGRTNKILLFTIKVNRQNSGQKTKGRLEVDHTKVPKMCWPFCDNKMDLKFFFLNSWVNT